MKNKINCKVLDMVVPRKNYKTIVSSLNFMCCNNLCGYLKPTDCDQVTKKCCHKVFNINPDSYYLTPKMTKHRFLKQVNLSKVKINPVSNLDGNIF